MYATDGNLTFDMFKGISYVIQSSGGGTPRFILVPAGIRYDNCDFVLQYARTFIASGKSLDGIRVHMSVGTEEEFEPAYAQWQLTSSFYRMATLMKAAAIPGLKWTTEVFPGETHWTVWPMAFLHGVQAVFRTEARRNEENQPGLCEARQNLPAPTSRA